MNIPSARPKEMEFADAIASDSDETILLVVSCSHHLVRMSLTAPTSDVTSEGNVTVSMTVDHKTPLPPIEAFALTMSGMAVIMFDVLNRDQITYVRDASKIHVRIGSANAAKAFDFSNADGTGEAIDRANLACGGR